MLGTILLTKTNVYVKKDGSLPRRPSFDKEVLTALLKGQVISLDAWRMLPPSIQRQVKCSDIADNKCPVAIRELAEADILLVIRSKDVAGGKKFRFDKFKCIINKGEIELWMRQ